MYEFKNLNEVEQQDKPTENTTVMAFESGTPKQIPASEFGGKGLVVDLRAYAPDNDGIYMISDINYDPIYEAIMSGQNVALEISDAGLDILAFPNAYTVLPNQGLAMMLFMLDIVTKCLFTNGSYHSTESASE